ncbi:MAG: fibronectin type III domain-containing protein [Minisyncoccia bacterium]
MRINIFNLLFVFTLIVVAESAYLIMKPPLAAEVPFGEPKEVEQVIAEAEAKRQAEVLAAIEAANQAQAAAATEQEKIALQAKSNPTSVVKSVIATPRPVAPATIPAPNFGSGDRTPPTAPSALSVLSLTDVQINLVWRPSTDNVSVAGYRIWRNGVYIGTTTNTKYAVVNLLPETEYSFTISAYDAAGNRSPESMKVLTATYPKLGVPTPNGLPTEADIASGVATPPAPSPAPAPTPSPTPTPTPPPAGNPPPPPPAGDTTPPSVPSGLVATVVSSTRIDLQWSASTDNVGVDHYNIYRSGRTTPYTSNIPSYSNTGLTPSTTYTYTVRAVDAAGNMSASSASVSATTFASPTTTTVNVTPASISPLSVTISAGSAVRWVYTPPIGGEIVYTFSPSNGAPSSQQIKLDASTTQKSFTFSSIGTYTYADPNGGPTGTVIVQ